MLQRHTGRAVNSPALFIPRGFGESGNAIFHSSGNGELKVIPRGIGSGNWGIKIFKVIPYKNDFTLDFLVLCME